MATIPSSSLPTDMHSPNTLCRVRFDTECILIPEPTSPSRMPRLLKKSYSLPLWRKKGPAPHASASASAAAATVQDASEPPSSPNDDGRTRFGLPRFSSRARSNSRDLGDSSRPPLVPCIVDHDHPRRARRPSLPIAPRLDVVTVPLRDCCLRCHPVTEESILEGNAWQEKFSRGARRKRSASVDAHPPHRRVNEELPGFDSILRINVDEVDTRRRSRDFSTSAVNVISLDDDEKKTVQGELGLLPSLTRQKLHVSTTPLDQQPVAKSSVSMDEDDEDQLFPLPSPRRTPNGSPIPSPLPTPSSSTTNLAKTVLGQQHQKASSPRLSPVMLPRTPTPPTPLRQHSSNSSYTVTSPIPVPGTHSKTHNVPPGILEPEPEHQQRFESMPTSILRGDSSDLMPDLTHSPLSCHTASPDLLNSPPPISIQAQDPEKAKLLPPLPSSPFMASSISTSPSSYFPIAIPERRSSPPPPPHARRNSGAGAVLSSPSMSPLVASSGSPSAGWRMHLPNAGTILKAGAEVLKGVSNMGASGHGVAV